MTTEKVCSPVKATRVLVSNFLVLLMFASPGVAAVEKQANAPVLAPIGDRTTSEGDSLLFAVGATDADGDTPVLSVENLPEGAEFNAEEGVFSWTPGFDAAGVYEGIVFTATDGADPALTDSETITLTVNDTNRPPVLDPVGNRQVVEEGSLTITFTATDPDGDALEFFADMLPDGATFDAATATLTYAPVLGDEGEYAVVAGVRDDGTPVEGDSEAFVISVLPLNPSAVLEEAAEILLADFAEADGDADGLLTYMEALALLPDLLESRFNAIDNDEDGALSEPELLEVATLSDVALEEAAQSLLGVFDNADSNGDDLLSMDETSFALQNFTVVQFMAIDANGDEFLSEEEISAVANERPDRLEDLAEQLLLMLDEADTDDDGSLSRAEAEAAIEGLVFADFQGLDLDGDDLITEAELTETATTGDADVEMAAELLREFFFTADGNGDGMLDREEVAIGLPSLTLHDFQQLDGDGDGLLSREELEVVAEVGDAALEEAAEALFGGFDDADGDSDGFLTREEAETARPELTLDEFQQIDADGDGLLSLAEVESAATLDDLVPLAPVVVEGVTAAGLTETTATLSWKTQVPSTGVVRYGTSAETLDLAAPATAAGGEHQVVLTGLNANTSYFARVDSEYTSDSSLAMSSRIVSFTTRRAPDMEPPVFTEAPAVQGVSDTMIFLVWRTDELADGEVRVNDGTDTFSRQTSFARRDQYLVVDGLTPDTEYELLVSAQDASGNLNSMMLTTRTLAAPDFAPARVVDGPLVTRLSGTAVGLRWATDRPATTEVGFSEDDSLRTVHTLPGLRTEHHLLVTGLNPETEYSLEARSMDWLGNGEARGGVLTLATNTAETNIAPVFTTVPEAVGATDTTATIRWSTDYPSDTVLRYWVGNGPRTTVTSSEHTLTHQVTLFGLEADTTYRFSCMSTTPAGGSSMATNTAGLGETTGAGLTFTTAAAPPDAVPEITDGPEIVGVTDEGITVRWTTDVLADSYVRYGLEDAVGRREFQDPTPTRDHLVTIRGLRPETTYQVLVSSAGVGATGTVSAMPMMITTALQLDSTAPVFTATPVPVLVQSRLAALEWRTDEIGSAYVTLRSSDTEVDSIQATAGLGQAQSVVLTNLRPATTYVYTIQAADQNQNVASTSGQFTTQAPVITVTPRRIIIPPGTTVALDVESEDPEETAFQFVSENPNIASVSSTGQVTGVTPGQVRILVADASGERVVPVTVTVLDIPEEEDFTGLFSLFAIFLLQNGESGTIGPCFIATAAAGTPLSPEIDLLRRFRDDYLLATGPGTMFVDLYYQASPPVADWVAQSPRLAATVRVLLIPVLLLVGLWMQSPLLVLLLGALGLWGLRYARRYKHRRARLA